LVGAGGAEVAGNMMELKGSKLFASRTGVRIWASESKRLSSLVLLS